MLFWKKKHLIQNIGIFRRENISTHPRERAPTGHLLALMPAEGVSSAVLKYICTVFLKAKHTVGHSSKSSASEDRSIPNICLNYRPPTDI